MSILLEGKTAAERKEYPLFSGFLNYFPDACLAVAHLSKVGNDQHNPGQPLHWSRNKSSDHLDTLARHMIDQAEIDTDGEEHLTKAAWRALAALQIKLEERYKKAVPNQRIGDRRKAKFRDAARIKVRLGHEIGERGLVGDRRTKRV